MLVAISGAPGSGKTTLGKLLAEALADLPGVSIDPDTVETNIVYFDVDAGKQAAETLCKTLLQRGVWMLPLGSQRVRAVTHLDVSREDLEQAITVLRGVFEGV